MSSITEWNQLLRRAVAAFIEWRFRKRSASLALIGLGVSILVAALGGLAVRFRSGDTEFEFGGGASFALSAVGLAVGAALVGLGTWLLLQDRREEREARERKRVLVVEQRGLQRRFSTALREALPRALVGQIVEKVIDVTPYFRDGVLAEQAAAFMHVRDARAVLRQGLGDAQPADVTVVYGGVSPVPLTFLAGTFFDDESRVVVMDWDRTAEGWRTLDGVDDGDRLSEPDLSSVSDGTDEVSIAISVSYEVDVEAARRLDPSRPMLALRMGKVFVGNHWSEDKQCAMAETFVRTLSQLANRGVRTVHLFLAAPNSVVFRLGRCIDIRNMPTVQVYQHERSDPIVFPWSIMMPCHGAPEPAYCPTLPCEVTAAP
ncbi:MULTISPECIES: SAVED domain-containing protein [Roseicella]|uniref:SAVED domain-containing protein n=2 Tax=Roseicella TaxID=2730923 RepID=A0A9X1IGI6_9PROT|nr:MULTISPECIES: SAVED domain-containing protein [Roseicella]MCB4824190.1 SAVED domain-containing protein [Roseicella aerolata]RAI56082.1 hypothetical protein DOO78_22850 [Roseicella frigidaeris]